MTVEHHHTEVVSAPPRGGIALVDNHSYVDWASILAGAAIAMAMSFVLLAFGSAIGLAVASPWSSSGPSAATVGIGAAIFVALVQIWAVAAGAYLAGRLRAKAHDSVRDEVRFRDGINGLVVWAIAVLAGAFVASSLISGAVRTATQAAGAVAGTTAAALAPVAERTIDLAFRTATPPPGDQQAQAARQNVRQAVPDFTEAERQRLGRIVTTGLTSGEFDAQDRAYLERLVAQKTSMSPDAAKARVNEVLSQAQATAKQTIETARKTTAFAGFWTALVFLLSGMAAWWAGSLGGAHRDEGALR